MDAQSGAPLKALSFLQGRWQGQCKLYRSASDVVPFTIVEHASFVLDDRVMKIEGVATAVIDGVEQVVGRGLGLIHYDVKAGAFRMHHYEANGATFDAPVIMTSSQLSYESVDSDGVRLRVRIDVTPDGRWKERVDLFETGRGWRLFREYDLRLVR